MVNSCLKKGEGDIALKVTSYQLPVTSNQLLLLLLLLLIINNSAKRIQNWGLKKIKVDKKKWG